MKKAVKQINEAASLLLLFPSWLRDFEVQLSAAIIIQNPEAGIIGTEGREDHEEEKNGVATG